MHNITGNTFALDFTYNIFEFGTRLIPVHRCRIGEILRSDYIRVRIYIYIGLGIIDRAMYFYTIYHRFRINNNITYGMYIRIVYVGLYVRLKC